MKNFLALTLIALVCGAAYAAPPAQKAQQLKAALSDHMAATPTIAGEALTVMTPGWTWSGAAGAVAGTKAPLHQPMHFALPA